MDAARCALRCDADKVYVVYRRTRDEMPAEKLEIDEAMEALKKEGINKVSLIAFTQNDIGNAFWKEIGWTKREDLNYYDFTLNEANITAFIQ